MPTCLTYKKHQLMLMAKKTFFLGVGGDQTRSEMRVNIGQGDTNISNVIMLLCVSHTDDSPVDVVLFSE